MKKMNMDMDANAISITRRECIKKHDKIAEVSAQSNMQSKASTQPATAIEELSQQISGRSAGIEAARSDLSCIGIPMTKPDLGRSSAR